LNQMHSIARICVAVDHQTSCISAVQQWLITGAKMAKASNLRSARAWSRTFPPSHGPGACEGLGLGLPARPGPDTYQGGTRGGPIMIARPSNRPQRRFRPARPGETHNGVRHPAPASPGRVRPGPGSGPSGSARSRG
jgi:hypothetical protein